MNDPAEDDAVASLLRLAEPRPAVSPQSVARVKAVIHGAWQDALRARRRRQTIIGVGAALAAGLVLALVRPPDRDPEPWPLIVATVVRALPGVGLPVGRTLGQGTLVDSGSGRLALRTASGASLRLDARTRVRLLGTSAIALEEGALYLDTPPDDHGFVVETALGRVTDEGTQFEARVTEGALRLRVREGRVVLGAQGRAVRAEAGEELRISRTGAERSRLATSGPEWAWIESLATAPPIEGRPLQAFLEWAARERGLRLQFEDEAARVKAGRVRLRGSLEGLTPVEALEAVMPTTSLRAHVEDDRLAIGWAR
jgi:ferric-dicitrate binding protein FerR (iron transport regulator)